MCFCYPGDTGSARAGRKQLRAEDRKRRPRRGRNAGENPFCFFAFLSRGVAAVPGRPAESPFLVFFCGAAARAAGGPAGISFPLFLRRNRFPGGLRAVPANFLRQGRARRGTVSPLQVPARFIGREHTRRTGTDPPPRGTPTGLAHRVWERICFRPRRGASDTCVSGSRTAFYAFTKRVLPA